MGCCGKRRQQITVGANSRRDASRGVQLRAGTSTVGGAKLRYVGSASILVKGSHSGGTYFFSAGQPEQFVNNGDIDSLLRMGLFQTDDL